MTYLPVIITALLAVAVIIILVIMLNTLKGERDKLATALEEQFRRSRMEQGETLAQALRTHGEMQTVLSEQLSSRQSAVLRELSGNLSSRQETLQSTVEGQQKRLGDAFANHMMHSNQMLENMRNTMETRLRALTEENEKKLEEMRQTVDQKLQKTLNERLNQSFSLVSERLEQVYKGLGEMQTLAVGVGDLKKVLSGVKTRGILGETQLAAILEELLTKEQYYENHPPRPRSNERVEFCIKLPGSQGAHVLLPIDAKFPADIYMKLVEAYEQADPNLIQVAQKNLEVTIKGFARDIRTKYIEPPYTTDFAVMFLPTEGLFAEVVRCGIAGKLQSEYRVIPAGPTTMAALLSSLQMGFRTLQIQKRSSEVWQVLASVKNEFETFGKALDQTQTRLRQAQDELENLVGVRTRQIQRKLKGVETELPEHTGENLPLTIATDGGE